MPETFNMKTSTTLREQFMAAIVCITSISKKCCIVFLPNSIMNSRSIYVGCRIIIILWIQELGGKVLFTGLYIFHIGKDKIYIMPWFFTIYLNTNISHAIVVPLTAQQISKKLVYPKAIAGIYIFANSKPCCLEWFLSATPRVL